MVHVADAGAASGGHVAWLGIRALRAEGKHPDPERRGLMDEKAHSPAQDGRATAPGAPTVFFDMTCGLRSKKL